MVGSCLLLHRPLVRGPLSRVQSISSTLVSQITAAAEETSFSSRDGSTGGGGSEINGGDEGEGNRIEKVKKWWKGKKKRTAAFTRRRRTTWISENARPATPVHLIVMPFVRVIVRIQMR